jgi:putative flavoprotein involved in K+ transport
MKDKFETVVIGGGQAGLATSYHLSNAAIPRVVLERDLQPAYAWRHQRWDSFTLVTPNWQTRLPGAEYKGPDPDGFMLREDVIRYLENYISQFQLPVRYGVEVTRVRRNASKNGYIVETNCGPLEAENVVVATGLFQKPQMPAISAGIPNEILQIHSSEYRNPDRLPAGATLVVGSAQSGAQIAQELYQNGRNIYLAVGSAGRTPRRYRGKDVNWWMDQMGAFTTKTVDQLPSPKAKFAGKPHVSGKGGGRTLNLHQFARDGVQILGHVREAAGGRLTLAPDLHDSLRKSDQFEADLVKSIDEFIEKNHIDAPPETLPDLDDGYRVTQITDLDLHAAGITSIIWAVGYSFDYSMIDLPVQDADNFPRQKRGITEFPGLYFVGMPWLHNHASGILFGVGQDAAHIVADMAIRRVVAAAA